MRGAYNWAGGIENGAGRCLIKQMRKLLCSAVALASLSTISSGQPITETFGSGANAFTMDFVEIGNAGNAPDSTGNPSPVGSVGHVYSIGKYEVSRGMIEKANAEGALGISLSDMSEYGGNGINRPATGVSWNEAAKFVNWLNTSKGFHPAYLFLGSGPNNSVEPNDNISLWAVGQYNGSNQYRHKDAYYFLPSVDEWYKAAYFDPYKASGAGYWNYPTSSDSAPVAVRNGTTAGTAVYLGNSWPGSPADIYEAGGLSPYGTMGQGGNVWEWNESARDGTNNESAEERVVRGGAYNTSTAIDDLNAFNKTGGGPFVGHSTLGFRIASVPEPSSLTLLALGGVVVALRRRKQA